MTPLAREDFVQMHEPLHHPQARELERRSFDLAEQYGLLDTENLARFQAFNTLTAYVYPEATIERAVACAQWCNWLFFFDDVHDEDAEACRDEAALRELMHKYLGALRTGEADDRDGFSRFTLDFRRRILGFASPAWFARFCASVEAYLKGGTLLAARNWAAGRTPGLAEYYRQRDLDSAVETAIDLIEVAREHELPAHLAQSALTRRVRQAANRSISLFNDLVSYPKEVMKCGNPNNLVHVLRIERGGSVQQAMHQAVKIVNAWTRELLALEPAFVAQDPTHAALLQDAFLGLRHWQRGNLESSLREARYRAPESMFSELHL